MASDLNSIVIIGRLTKKPDIKYTKNGVPKCDFSIANNTVFYDKNRQKVDEVSFFDITVWAKMAEVCNQYLDRGSKVAVRGHLKQLRWQTVEGLNRYKIVIIADSVQFLSGGGNGGNGGYGNNTGSRNSVVDSQPEYNRPSRNQNNLFNQQQKTPVDYSSQDPFGNQQAAFGQGNNPDPAFDNPENFEGYEEDGIPF